MRGRALECVSGRAETAAHRAAWEGISPPSTPDQEEALPLVGSPASEPFGSGTSDQRMRPFGIRAQGALLPETPAQGVGFIPLPPHPCRRCLL
jgi:hypothetical protein